MDELYKKLNEFFKINGFSIVDASPSQYYLKLENPVLPLEHFNFLDKCKIKNVDHYLYEHFTKKLTKEISGWPDDLFLQLCEKSKNTDINKILSSHENTVRYVTHPHTLGKVTLKSIPKYVKLLKNEELLENFFQSLLEVEKINAEDLKKFLESKKEFKVLNALFSEKIADICEVVPPAVSSHQINFHLLPSPELSGVAHNLSSINAHLLKMIKIFDSFNPPDSVIKGIHTNHISPKDGIKSISILAKDTYCAKAFVEVFFDIFKSNLKEENNLNEFSSTRITKNNISNILDKTQKLALTYSLGSSLEHKETLKQRKI